MKWNSFLLGLGAVLAGALPLAAQSGEQARTSATVERAEVGKLVAVGGHTNRIVVLPQGMVGAYQLYDTNEKTSVQGLGAITQVNRVPQDYVGSVVVVTYVGNESLMASGLKFTEDRQIRTARGAIESLDRTRRMLVLRSSEGQDRRFNLGSSAGAVIDGGHGLLEFSDLQVGQEVTVYFARRPGGSDVAGVAHLIRAGKAPRPAASAALRQRPDSEIPDEMQRLRAEARRYRALRDSLARSSASRPAVAEGLSSTERATMEKTIHFRNDRSELTSEAMTLLRSKARVFRANPTLRVVIVGHASEPGTEPHNLALGLRRAEGARGYLVSRGVARSRIEVATRGKGELTARGSDEAAHAANRRAEFRILGAVPSEE